MNSKKEFITIIVLSQDKKNSLVEITLPKNNKQIFASQYKTYLPTKEEFQAQLAEVGSAVVGKSKVG